MRRKHKQKLEIGRFLLDTFWVVLELFLLFSGLIAVLYAFFTQPIITTSNSLYYGAIALTIEEILFHDIYKFFIALIS